LSDPEECVFVSGIQSYTLKSMRRNDMSLTTAGGAVTGGTVVVAGVGFLIILNFLICMRVVCV
jgi:hypothetical protein